MTTPSILYVITAVGGTPPDFALPRLCRRGEVHLLAVGGIPATAEQLYAERCATVHRVDPDAPMPDAIVTVARAVRADAVVAFSETAIVAVAQACQELGLPGPGPNVLTSRDKYLMRQGWQAAGLPVPAFAAVRSLADLRAAFQKLAKPFLLKPTWLAGSLAQVLIDQHTDLAAAWAKAIDAVEQIDGAGVRDFLPAGRGAQFIAEEIIQASTDSWYDVDGYGDYVSVEGVVAAGRYHPICITARLPTLPPFIEWSFHSPTVLAPDNQRRIEDMARAAVDALQLDFCCTHTEIKLQPDHRLCLLESAARLGGALIPLLVDEAFGVDLIDLLVSALLGGTPELPDRMLTSGRPGRSVASLMMVAADSSGRPWDELPPYRPDRVDWGRLTSPGTRVELMAGGRPVGSAMPAFSPTGGTLNYAGALLLHGADPLALRTDSYRILDGLEGALLDQAALSRA